MARSTSTSKTKKTSGSKKKTGTTARTPSRTRKTTSGTTRSRTTGSSKTTTQRKKTTTPAPIPEPLSTERKIDIAGIIFIVIGLLTLLNLMTSLSGDLTKVWAGFLHRWIGWGAYALPLVLLLIGTWFLLSKMDRFPGVSPERIIGIILIFFNLITLFQLLDASFGSLSTPPGGGILGGALYRGLETGLGKAGTVIVLIAWLLVALVLLIDLSMSDLVGWLAEKFKHSHSRFANFLRKKVEEHRLKAEKDQDLAETEQQEKENIQSSPVVPGVSPVASVKTEIESPTPEKTWIIPEPEEILNPVQKAPIDEESDEDKARVIEETLRSFNAPGKVVEIRRGPTITMFGVEPEYNENRTGRTRVRVSNITRLSDDLAMALKASRIRIQAPVPGKGYVGIEVPNLKTSMVSMLELVTSLPFQKHKSPLKFALGKDVTGAPATADLTAMPHLLIAGTTGSGKSVCVNAILTGYLLHLNPDQLRLMLVDPKRVEFSVYNGIPHLLTDVIMDPEKVVGALQWMLREMDLRYRIFENFGVRNIEEYNKKTSNEGGKTLPFIVVVIDELADMMLLAPDETERALTRLAQLARATGIHLIIATQRPSADVITGLIKANFPARIAFAVASNMDSRVILDQPGAERLLGRGDMLFQAPDAPAPVRLQGAYVSEDEVARLARFWQAQSTTNGAPERPDKALYTSINNLPMSQEPLWKELQKDPDEDPLAQEALRVIRKEGRASVSMLQRKLRIGYTRASRMVEKFEEKGIISEAHPQTGTREVLDWGDYPPLKED
jgi:S-DNA-T family DNA segregation ATPase FtsK/SpoIIIE